MSITSIAVFDLETTGIDVETDVPVSAAVAVLNLTERTILDASGSLKINPGRPIPPEATAIHGITDDDAARGIPLPRALIEIEAGLITTSRVMPLVIMNAPYDLTMIDRCLRREHGRGLELPGLTVLDPLVLDKRLDPYRKGKRTLDALATHYGITLDGAHNARADAIAAGQITFRILEHPTLAGMTAEDIHARQIEWREQQAESFADYLRTVKGDRAASDAVLTTWPMHPFTETSS